MKNNIFIVICLVLTLLLLISCENTTESPLDDRMVLNMYGSADSTVDSLYLSRYGELGESITKKNLGISGAVIQLFQYEGADSLSIGFLKEYPERKGVYYLPAEAGFDGFKEGVGYGVTVTHPVYASVYAKTVCPQPLEIESVYNGQTGEELVLNGTETDTLYYARGIGSRDYLMAGCTFTPLEEQLASFRIIPDQRQEEFWLEDTTSAVWDDYPISIEYFKDKDLYGKDNIDYLSQELLIYWVEFYHEGYHSIVFARTDEAFELYRAGVFSEDPASERYTNVIGGAGVFTISNATHPKSKYRVYVKSLETR